jgi:prevent-host-death family protein
MTTVGTFHAKTHLAQLLERVERGERVTITRRGKPIAMLVPAETPEPVDVGEVVRRMLAVRDASGPRLGPGLSIRELREEGRRF